MQKNKDDITDIIDIKIDATGSSFWKNEQDRAIKDLIKTSQFQCVKNKNRPYCIYLHLVNKKINLSITSQNETDRYEMIISMSPYRRLIRDYFMLIDSYEYIRAQGNLQKLETLDMARRALHNEGAELLQDRLEGKVLMSHETARLFFTLICTLWHN